MIKAITFDFWDTIVKDDSDEPKRAAQGLASKAATRLQLLMAEISQHHPHITAEQVKTAFDHANQRFNHCWKMEYYTPTVASRFQDACHFLDIELTPGFQRMVQEIEEMEILIPPDFAPGIHEALAELAPSYKLGLISDAIHTPGRGIRHLLEQEGLLQYFSHWVFSDEVGRSKPDPVMFEQASAGLGVPLTHMAHIGDRESNDVSGPLALGMKAILYTGAIDRDSANTRATAICRDYKELPAILKQLNNP